MMRRIWVDTDVALGAAHGDVDDGYALAAVARAPGVELLGVSTVFGNTRAGIAADCARRLLQVSGARAEVVSGAERPGAHSAAAEAMAQLPAGTSLLALGPLTNVAAALELDASLAGRVEVRAVGDNLSSWGRWPPWWPFEFNFAKDPAAAHAVFAASWARRIFPLCVCHRLRAGLVRLRQLGRLGLVGEYVTRSSWRWLAYAPLRYRALSFPLWDLVPALDALGVLAVVGAELKLEPRGRGGLEPAATSSWWARDFDPALAWATFCQLVAAS